MIRKIYGGMSPDHQVMNGFFSGSEPTLLITDAMLCDLPLIKEVLRRGTSLEAGTGGTALNVAVLACARAGDTESRFALPRSRSPGDRTVRARGWRRSE